MDLLSSFRKDLFLCVVAIKTMIRHTHFAGPCSLPGRTGGPPFLNSLVPSLASPDYVSQSMMKFDFLNGTSVHFFHTSVS